MKGVDNGVVRFERFGRKADFSAALLTIRL
jgi:hypothetical protein